MWRCHAAGKESPLSEGQKAAVMRASRAPLIVLTGGPGCGKTFATKAIVQLWQSQQKDIRLAAPTGLSFSSSLEVRPSLIEQSHVACAKVLHLPIRQLPEW